MKNSNLVLEKRMQKDMLNKIGRDNGRNVAHKWATLGQMLWLDKRNQFQDGRHGEWVMSKTR